MKKIDSSNIASGVQQPFIKPTWVHLQEAFQEPIYALGRMLAGQFSGVTVLYGCVNSTPGSGTFTISAGAVFYNDEVYLVDAATLTPGGGQVVIGTITTTYIASDPLLFTDGSSHDVHEIRKIVFSSGTTVGTLDYSAYRFVGKGQKLTVTSGMISPTGTTVSSVTLAYVVATQVGNLMHIRYFFNFTTAAATLTAFTVQLSSIMTALNAGVLNGAGIALLDQTDAPYCSVGISNNSTLLNFIAKGGINFANTTTVLFSGEITVEVG